eukprot:scaffold116596_cov37-Prasinocladus_malaysianus.AAC.2
MRAYGQALGSLDMTAVPPADTAFQHLTINDPRRRLCRGGESARRFSGPAGRSYDISWRDTRSGMATDRLRIWVASTVRVRVVKS